MTASFVSFARSSAGAAVLAVSGAGEVAVDAFLNHFLDEQAAATAADADARLISLSQGGGGGRKGAPADVWTVLDSDEEEAEEAAGGGGGRPTARVKEQGEVCDDGFCDGDAWSDEEEGGGGVPTAVAAPPAAALEDDVIECGSSDDDGPGGTAPAAPGPSSFFNAPLPRLPLAPLPPPRAPLTARAAKAAGKAPAFPAKMRRDLALGRPSPDGDPPPSAAGDAIRSLLLSGGVGGSGGGGSGAHARAPGGGPLNPSLPSTHSTPLTAEERALPLADLAMRRVFGHSAWRPRQREVVAAALAGADAFVLLPTGGGKSLCFQLPAVLSAGTTVVVSPLLSLVQDQVAALLVAPGGGVPAACLSSALPAAARRAVLNELGKDRPSVKLLYVTPEQLVKSAALGDALARLATRGRFARLVVDEAHCVSAWGELVEGAGVVVVVGEEGEEKAAAAFNLVQKKNSHIFFLLPPSSFTGHDFRPDYVQIGAVRAARFPSVPITALTATAPASVVVDVLRSLRMPGARQFTASFFRANLTLRVVPKPSGTDPETGADAALAALAAFVLAPEREAACGIVYCLSRDDTEAVAAGLAGLGASAAHYHAGMSASARSRVQAAWQAGAVRVVVATIAFGMGIDKVRTERMEEKRGGKKVGNVRGFFSLSHANYLLSFPSPSSFLPARCPLCRPLHALQVLGRIFPGGWPGGAGRPAQRVLRLLHPPGRGAPALPAAPPRAGQEGGSGAGVRGAGDGRLEGDERVV